MAMELAETASQRQLSGRMVTFALAKAPTHCLREEVSRAHPGEYGRGDEISEIRPRDTTLRSSKMSLRVEQALPFG